MIIRFDQDFMDSQKPGAHTVRVEFLNHMAETTITVDGTGAGGTVSETGDAPDNNTYNPSTGGYPTNGTDHSSTGDTRGVWTALLLGSLGGSALVSGCKRKTVK